VIDQSALPSWPQILQRLGEPRPRRGRARCPIHGGDSPTSMSINEQNGVFHCHVCHAGGDKLAFVQKALGCDFKGDYR
jgi:DNA primase